MADKLKYPIGTRIRYIGCCEKCNGEIGKIVEAGIGNKYCYIILPKSSCSDGGKLYASWNNLELLAKKNEQLLFEFMSNEE